MPDGRSAHHAVSVTAFAAAVLATVVLATAGCSGGSGGSGRPGPAGADRGSSPAASSAPAAPTVRYPAGTCRQGACTRTGVDVWSGVPFTRPVPCGPGEPACRLTMDVYAPATGGPWPLVLLVPGGPQPPGAYTYLDPGAFAIAARGVVAMSIAWRQGPAFGAGYPASFGDVACAVGVARRLAPAYGARPGRLVLAGHSLGGWAGAVLALAPAPVTPAPGTCGPTAGSPRPDALVTLSGAVHEVRRPSERAYLAAFFGGDRARRAAVRRAADPLALARSPGARPGVPVTVVAGGGDTVVPASVARSFLAALRAAGRPARLVSVPGADHLGVLTAPAAVDAVVAAARRPSP